MEQYYTMVEMEYYYLNPTEYNLIYGKDFS